MNKRDVVTVAVRLMALYFIMVGLYHALAISPLAGSMGVWILISRFFYLVLALILWFIAGFLAKAILPNGSEPANISIESATALEQTVLILSGLLILINYIPSLIAILVYGFGIESSPYPDLEDARLNGLKQTLVQYSISIIFGLVLVARSSKVLNFARWLENIKLVK